MDCTSESVLADTTDSVSIESEGCNKPTETSTVPTTQRFGFDVQSGKTDLALVIEGKSVYVSRAVLELTSPVFQTLLDANEGTESLELVGPTYGDFVEFLACFYPGKTHSVTGSNVFGVLPLAEKYAVSHLLSQCKLCLEAMLGSSSIAPQVLVSCVQAVCTFKFDTLKAKCETTLKRLVLNDTDKLNILSSVPFGTTAEFYNMLMPLMVDKTQKYRYLSVGLSKKREVKLAEWDNVEYFTVTLCTETSLTVEQKSKSARICGLEFSIVSKATHSKGEVKFWLQYCSENTLLTSCEGEVTFVVVNNVPWKDHWKQSTQFKSSPSKSMKTLVPAEVGGNLLFNSGEGYIMNGQVNIIAHVLLNTTIGQ